MISVICPNKVHLVSSPWPHHTGDRPSSRWIGFWFNIPGVTADPTQVASLFDDGGYDVVISGIGTTEAAVVATQKRKAGRKVWAIPYDYQGACQGADEVCLGVPYFNWGPRLPGDGEGGA